MKITEISDIEILKVLGWSIIHTVWQFLVLFAILKAILALIDKRSKFRYIISLTFFIGAISCSVFTFYHEYRLFFGSETSSENVITHSEKAILNSKSAIANSSDLTIIQSPADVFFNFLNAISSYITIGWIAGIIFYLLKITNASFYLNNLRKLPSETYPLVTKKMLELCSKMNIKSTIKLIITNSATEAFTFGYLKPVILLPISCVIQLPMEQLEMIIAHELAHIKRFDYAVNLLQTTFEAIYFYNPFFSAISDIV